MSIENIKSLEGFLNSPEVSSVSKALSNSMHGINISGTPIINNYESAYHELVFFVRPKFNMTSVNLQNDRRTANLLTKSNNTIGSYIRGVLDYRLSAKNKVDPAMLDNELPFISLFTNEIMTLSGWPDNIMPTYVTSAGKMGEQYLQADGQAEFHGKFDLQAKFKRVPGNIVSRVIDTWVLMMSLQNQSIVAPYFKDELDGVRNMDTRIYHLVLDSTRRLVTAIAATGISLPTVSSRGGMFDYNRNEKAVSKEFDIKFECTGAYYDDPISIQEFNMTTARINTGIRKMLKGEPHNMFKVPHQYHELVRYNGYPIIDVDTMEFNIWLNKDSEIYINNFKDEER